MRVARYSWPVPALQRKLTVARVELQPLQDTEIARFVGDQPKLIKSGPKRNCCGELPVQTKRRVANGN
jgi:hypothetical protein